MRPLGGYVCYTMIPMHVTKSAVDHHPLCQIRLPGIHLSRKGLYIELQFKVTVAVISKRLLAFALESVYVIIPFNIAEVHENKQYNHKKLTCADDKKNRFPGQVDHELNIFLFFLMSL